MRRIPLGVALSCAAAAVLWTLAGDAGQVLWHPAAALQVLEPSAADSSALVVMGGDQRSALDAQAGALPTPDAVAAGARSVSTGTANRLESEVLQAYALARTGRGVEAGGLLDAVLAEAPSFRPALTLQGLLASEWTQPVADAEQDPGTLQRTLPPGPLTEESSLRMAAVLHRPVRRRSVPANLLQLGSEVRVVLAADLAESRLYVFQHDPRGLWLRSDHYLSTGTRGSFKQNPGDQRTPIGVYSLQSRLPDNQLPALAGHGAWPLTFPNRWDQWQGHLGSGIWVHGTAPGQFDGLPHSTNGCLALSNADLDLLAPDLAAAGTVLVVADHLEWLSPAMLAQRRGTAIQRLVARAGQARRPAAADSVYAYPGDAGVLLVRRAEGSNRMQDEFWPAGALDPLPAARS